MTDILDDEPPLEGQRGYKGPAFFEKLFWSRVEHDRDADD